MTEPLEELADAQVFLALQADVLWSRDAYPDDIQAILVDVDDQVRRLAFAVADTQMHLTGPGAAAAA